MDPPHPVEEHEELSRKILRSYFDAHGTVRHQIESYDYFLDVLLQRIITENSDVEVVHGGESHKLSFGRTCIPVPTIRESNGFIRTVEGPAEAMARNLTYSSAVLVDVTHTVSCVDTETIKSCDTYREVALCKLPMMVRSNYCYLSQRPGDMSRCIFDSGGYFVINGLEKSVIAMQKLRTNAAFVWHGRPPSRALLQCEVRSCHEHKLRSTSTLSLYLMPGTSDRPPTISVSLPFIETQVPLVGLFILLGCDQLDDMVRACSNEGGAHGERVAEIARAMLSEGAVDKTREELLEWLGKEGTTEPTRERQQRYLQHILGSECLPHMGLGNDPAIHAAKILYLGHMVHRLLMVHLGLRPVDSRDHYKNKRCDATGHLMSLQFRQLFRAYLKGLHSQLTRALSSSHRQLQVPRIVAARKITAGFKYAFATGRWGVQARTNTAQSGVVQALNRNSIFASLADKRRLSCPANRDSKNAGIRMLDESSYGIICPAESPEGASCGLVVNLAVLAHVRVHACEQSSIGNILGDLCPALEYRPLAVATAQDRSCGARVFHNGVLHGFVPQRMGPALCQRLRELRTANVLPFDASVSHDAETCEVHIGTDAGCLCRPLIVADRINCLRAAVERAEADGAPMWHMLVESGILTYVDKEEEACLRVASTYGDYLSNPRVFTHMEVHPAAILGMSASNIPFAEYNQAPRNVYQCAMGKQAIGVDASNTTTQLHTVGYGLWYPQRPVVGTWLDDVVGTKHIPCGTNMIVAIACYGGYNQEDAFIVNRASLQRGMARAIVSRTVRDELANDGYSFRRPPDECEGRRAGCYSKLHEDGTVPVGTVVHQGDVVIGKVMDADPKDSQSRPRDCSSSVRCTNPCVVTRVLKTKTRDGFGLIKTQLSDTRAPIVGDKLTSRHGQKGVIGATFAPEDMPFTSDGLIPDVIMNPHALPSRMTIGQLVEMLTATLCCKVGRFGDGTAFCGHRVEDISAALESAGMDPMGEHEMFNGTNGEKMQARVFAAPVFMQSLKHMVSDKCHARASGPVHHITRQPTEGRRQDGGLRFGEMERDCLVAHGASAMLQERLFLQSDPYRTHVCKRCGMLAEPPCVGEGVRARTAHCRACGDGSAVSEVAVPYATKLFMQEVSGLNMAMRLRLEGDDEP